MRHDLIVLGAGPAGAVAATVAADAGMSVALLDRGRHPGAHLPESWSGRTRPLLARLGFPSPDEAFRDRTSVRFLDRTGEFGVMVGTERLPGHREPAVVRLDRTRFDAALVAHAVSRGVAYLPGRPVTGLDVADRPVVECGRERFTGGHLVDASGKSALLATHLGLLEEGPPLDPRVAVFSLFAPAAPHRLAEPDTMTVIGIDGGYIFVIPAGERFVSVGVVVGREHAARHGGDPAELHRAELAAAPVLDGLLDGAERLLPVIPVRNRAYTCTRYAGPAWTIAGEAAVFGDPFGSTGLDLALQSGELAGLTAAAAWSGGSREEAAERYGKAFGELLGADTVTGEPGGDLVRLLADPHLPAAFPLAALLRWPPGASAPGATTPGGSVPGATASGSPASDAVRAVRDTFARL